MKIAYLIAAHGNYRHLQRLINALNENGCAFYIHIDKKAVMPDIEGDNVTLVKERVRVNWSGFSQVKATTNLMRAAIEKQYDYYAYISGVDYPIKPIRYLEHKLAEGGEYIQLQAMGEDVYAPLSRYKFFYFTDYYNRRNKQEFKTRFFLALQNRMRKLRIKKRIPFKLYTGASWFILSRDCVDHILRTIRGNKDYIRFFKTGFCSDESFFQTIIGNSEFSKNIKGNLTYSDWSTTPGPAIITEAHLTVLKKLEDKFFARKFTDGSEEVILRIDEILRK